MPKRIVQFNNVASHGIVRDAPAIELPAGPDGIAWTDGQNIRFKDNEVQKFHGQVVTATTTATCFWAQFAGQNNTGNFIWALQQDQDSQPLRLAAMNTIQGIGAFLTVTTQWTSSDNRRIQGAQFPPFFVINDRQQYPVYFHVTTTPDTKLLDYSAVSTWAGAQKQANIIRSFGRFLFALGIRTAGTPLTDIVAWSTDAASNAMPTTWDPADTTENAGETSLSGGGEWSDLLPMSDREAYLYKTYQTWRVRFVGGANVFSFEEVFQDRGMFKFDCGVTVDRNQIVLGANDIYIHDGARATSLIDKRRRNHIFDRIKRHDNSVPKVAHNIQKHEVWFALPLQSERHPNTIYVFNYEDNTWGERDAPPNFTNMHAGAVGRLDNTVLSALSEDLYQGATRIVLSDFTGANVADKTFTMNGTVMTSYVQRTGLDFDKPGITKMVTKVWPRMTATSGNVTVRVGSQKHPEDTVAWSAEKTFTPGTDVALSFDVKGRYHAIEFKSSADMNWTLSGFEVEVRDGGRY